MRWMLTMVFALALGLGACGKDKAKPTPKSAPAGHMHAPKATSGGGDTAKVTVPKAGRQFKPPIQKSQLPDGVWYCDMGTVEYARLDKGDGKCPICGMKLKHKGPAH